MAGDRHRPGGGRGKALRLGLLVRLALLGLFTVLIAVTFWNAVKPLPPGTRVIAVATRLGEADIELLQAELRGNTILSRQMAQIGSAEQLVVVDQSPLPRELAQALLLRKHNRPALKVVVLSDPAAQDAATAGRDLIDLERGGIIVARVDTDRLRDSNLLYSGLWRLALSWQSTPFDEAPESFAARARRLNYRIDHRQVLTTDDGVGGWISVFGAAGQPLAIGVHGSPAHDILASELRIAGWSSDDDRLPAAPPALQRRAGSIDARYLSEGGISTTLGDAVRSAARGDELNVAAHALGERTLIDALTGAASRGAHVQVLLDSIEVPNAAVAGELQHGGIELRFRPESDSGQSLVILHHGADLTVFFTSAPLTRRGLKDFNLESGIELRLTARSEPGRALAGFFAAQFRAAPASPGISDVPMSDYLRYRVAEALGLFGF